MGIRATVGILSAYIIQLVLYYVGTPTINAFAVTLLNGPYGGTPGLGTFLANINIEWQAGMAVEGIVILVVLFIHPFIRRPDTGRL